MRNVTSNRSWFYFTCSFFLRGGTRFIPRFHSFLLLFVALLQTSLLSSQRNLCTISTPTPCWKSEVLPNHALVIHSASPMDQETGMDVLVGTRHNIWIVVSLFNGMAEFGNTVTSCCGPLIPCHIRSVSFHRLGFIPLQTSRIHHESTFLPYSQASIPK